MHSFCDLHVGFDGAPGPGRFGSTWVDLVDEQGSPWIGWSGTVEVRSASAPGWQVWAAGDVDAYRDDDRDPLERFAADLAEGRADPSRLDAHAVVVAWERGARRVHVITNRLGTVHVYRSDRAVGTSFATVASPVRPALDWVGITGFCGFGFFPADRTYLDGVRIVRPATWLVFDVHGAPVREERTWSWWYEPRQSSVDEIVDEFHERWTRVITRSLRSGRVVVPVSGGLDSRTVLAGATGPSIKASVRTFTYGYPGSDVEVGVARRVGRARSLPPVEQVVEPYLFDRLDDVAGAVEGFVALTFSRQVGAAEVVASLGDRVVGGHWGDVWFDGVHTDGSGARPIADEAFGLLARRGRESLLDELCRPHLDGADPADVLRGLVSDELARLPDLGDREMTLKALKTEQWSFRWTLAGVRAYQLGARTVLPFYADPVVDLFLTVPADVLDGRALQVAYLRRHHPDLAAVRWQQTGRSLLDRWWEAPAATARRAMNKAVRAATGRTVVQRNWEVQYLGADRPEHLRALAGGIVAAGLLEEEVVDRLVGGFVANPTPAGAHVVDTLATLGSSLVGR